MASANNKSSTSPAHGADANNSPATTKEKNEVEENGFDMANDADGTKQITPALISCTVLDKWNSCRQSIWNSEKKELIGRTWDSWAKIGLFYLVFYSCLAVFFSIMLAGFFSTLDERSPTQTGLYSLIKSNPGMGFRPMTNVESTLIRFRQGEPATFKDLVANIDDFLKDYKNRPEASRGRNCSEMTINETLDDSNEEFCEFDLAELGTECTQENNYGYNENKPCILLKINKVYGWQPRSFTDDELNDSSNKFAQEAKKMLGARIQPGYIGVTCEGENEGDADNLRGIKFYPDLGFSFKHFPYYNQKNYLPPVVFAQFDTPREGALIQIWCRLWVSNIKHHKNDKAGSIHFELLVN